MHAWWLWEQQACGRWSLRGSAPQAPLTSKAPPGIANLADLAGQWETNLFITPGFNFQVVDALVTNFHLPKSTLLMLVSAFAGYPTIRKAYNHAIVNRYRFFSYGDAMFLRRLP